ncbi:MAG: hypothetical protein WC873_01935 [Candidatus Gracilibacteria bacterium]
MHFFYAWFAVDSDHSIPVKLHGGESFFFKSFEAGFYGFGIVIGAGDEFAAAGAFFSFVVRRKYAFADFADAARSETKKGGFFFYIQ